MPRHAAPSRASLLWLRNDLRLADHAARRAAMRQLWQTGWMHDRARIIVASFLAKHLLLAWQAGKAWFRDTLVDAALASNSANWQLVAGSAADAAAYVRICNPVPQGRRLDPDGAYVHRLVPELGRLTPRFVHAPRQAPSPALAAAGVALGAGYPRPIVDLATGRVRARAAFAALRGPAT
jgi:deoxyribodipyrimidine photo-lyase